MDSSPIATSSRAPPWSSSRRAKSSVPGPTVRACDSTVTPRNEPHSSAIRGRSDGGTARRSKKLLALYSLIRSGVSGRSPASASSICFDSAPSGVAPSIVYCHRSQNEHVKGHSAPARRIVIARSIVPSGRRSLSMIVPCAFHGSTNGFGGLRPRRRRSSAAWSVNPSFASLRTLRLLRLRGVQRLEVPAVAQLAFRKEARDLGRRHRTVLEPALREHRHLDTDHRVDAARDHLTLERVQPLVGSLRQRGERDGLRHADYSRP